MKTGNKRRTVAVAFVAFLVGGAAAAASTPLDPVPSPPDLILPCEEETVYGTVIVLDQESGTFGLEGTEYQFVADDPRAVREIDGMQVRMEVGPDCSIRDFRIIGDDDSLT